MHSIVNKLKMQNCILKMIEMIKFMLYTLHQELKKKKKRWPGQCHVRMGEAEQFRT